MMNELEREAMEAAQAINSRIYDMSEDADSFEHFGHNMFRAGLAHARSETPAEPWRPVSDDDELPEESGTYLVAFRWNDTEGPFVRSADFLTENEDPHAWIIDGISGEPEIVAWMPIPPYNPTESVDGSEVN